MQRLNVQPGDRFHRLTVIREEQTTYKRRFLCRCDCGKETVVKLGSVTSGYTKSCGCLSKEITSRRSTTHGKSWTRIWMTWCHMRIRCENPADKDYANYGGRGISVCDRWQVFANFYADMGDPPFKGASLDRIDNHGNYEPSNVRWATPIEQSRNQRRSVHFTFNGERKHIREWVELTGLSYDTLLNRRKQGWTDELILTTPPRGTAKWESPLVRKFSVDA